MFDRNLNPHRSAIVAMYLYGDKYSKQDRGIVDFFEQVLTESERKICRELVARLHLADGDES